MKVGDYAYLFRGDEYVYGWGSITRLGQPEMTREGLRREVTVIQSFLQSQLVSVADLTRLDAFSNYERLKNNNLSSFDEEQVRYLNARFPIGQSPPNPEDVMERESPSLSPTPILNQFVRGQVLQIDETRFYEFKTVQGSNPINPILNKVDEYVVSFLNIEDRRGGDKHCRIFWGIQDSPHTIIGVALTGPQRDDLRLRVGEKLAGIEPRLGSSAYYIELHPVSDGTAPIPDLYVVEVGVAPGERGVFYCSGTGSFFMREDGRTISLRGQSLHAEIRRRILAQTQEAVMQAVTPDLPSLTLRFNSRTDHNRLQIKNVGSGTAKNIQVKEVPLNNPNYPDKAIRFRSIATLQVNEEVPLVAEYTAWGTGEEQNSSGIFQDPNVIQFLNNARYTLTANFTDIHDRPYTQTLSMDAGNCTPGATNRARTA